MHDAAAGGFQVRRMLIYHQLTVRYTGSVQPPGYLLHPFESPGGECQP